MAKKKAHLKRRTATRTHAAARSAVRSTVKTLAKAGAQLTFIVPPVRADEDYRGILLDKTGKLVAHLIEHRKEVDGTQAECMDMVAALGAEYQLPDCQEAALCYANGKDAHQKRWYWTREDYPGDSDYAYVQYFGLGTQSLAHKGTRCVGRAVRRVAI